MVQCKLNAWWCACGECGLGRRRRFLECVGEVAEVAGFVKEEGASIIGHGVFEEKLAELVVGVSKLEQFQWSPSSCTGRTRGFVPAHKLFCVLNMWIYTRSQ